MKWNISLIVFKFYLKFQGLASTFILWLLARLSEGEAKGRTNELNGSQEAKKPRVFSHKLMLSSKTRL